MQRWGSADVARDDDWAPRALVHALQALQRSRLKLSYMQSIGREPAPGRQVGGSSPVGNERKGWPLSLRERAPDNALPH